MAKLIFTHKHYPVSIGSYFKQAFKALGHEVWSVGTFSPTIPWKPEVDYSNFLDIPDYETPADLLYWEAHDVLRSCPFKPDAIISVDAAYYIVNANKIGIPSAIILSDPHALGQHYLNSIEFYDYVFCMQHYYMQPYKDRHSAVWHLPYAASHLHHYWMGTNFDNRPYDVCMISGSLHFPKRAQALAELERVGLNMRLDSGLLFDDATKEYNQSVIGFNRSTELDLPARFFENLAMRNLVLTDRVPDLAGFDGLQEDVHYVAYDSMEEMVDKASYYASNRDAAWRIASNGYGAYYEQDHTYMRRALTVLDAMGLSGK